MAKSGQFFARAVFLSLSFALIGQIAPQLSMAADGGQQKTYTYKGKQITESQFEALIAFNNSFQLMNAHEYQLAAEKLRETLKLDPTMYQAHSNYGFVLARLGQIDEGIAEVKKARALAPDAPEPMATSGALYQSCGRLQDAIDNYRLFTQRFPTHPLTPNVVSVIKQLEQENAKQQFIVKNLKPGEGTKDYFPFATYDSVTKWTADKFPLKVHVPSDAEVAAVGNYKPQYGQALRQSFQDWQQRSNNAVSFTYVPTSAEANIDCVWTNNPANVSRPSEGGEAKVQYDTIRGIDKVQIILLTRTPDGDANVPVNLIKAAALHEVGHAMGVLGHSPNPEDVMFCSVPAADLPRPLTERDGNTLAYLYSPSVVMEHHYHATGDASDKVALNNDGVSLAATQDFAKAADRFEAALKLDPNYEPSKRNLAACLNNLAILAAQENRFADAAMRFKRALELEGNNADSHKRATMLKNLSIIYTRLNKPAEAQAAKAQADKLMADGSVTSKAK